MAFKYCFIVPIAQGILYVVTLSTTYLLSVVINEDVPAIFPYISDTGVWSIERCLFSFMLGLGSLLMIATIYIRFRQVKEVLLLDENVNLSPKLRKLNLISMYLGVVAVLGVFGLGCFPVQPFIVPHLIGAVAAFNSGFGVLVVQTYISFKIYPTLGNKSLNMVRVAIVSIIGIALGLCTIFAALSLMLFTGADITQWTEASGGYTFHLISVANEWILVLGVVFYLSLYAGEFKSIVLYKPNMDLVKVVA